MLYHQEILAPSDLIEAAKTHEPARTLVAGADTPLILQSVKAAKAAGLIDPVLLGIRGEMEKAAEDAEFDLSQCENEDVDDATTLAARLSIRAADPALGAIMKGHIKTHDFVGALLSHDAGLVHGSRLTHVMHLSFPHNDRGLIITDAALNVAPDRATFKSIIRNAIAFARSIGIERPKVALLSATESVNPAMPSSQIAAGLTAWARDHVDDADVFGPLAFDNAVSPKAARIKGIENAVAGSADIVVVPNIEAGNVLFKSLVYCAGACAAGLVLGGRIPVILTSRAAPPAARLTSVALATLVSQSRTHPRKA